MMMMMEVLISLLFIGVVVFVIFKFATADGDFTLISKGSAKWDEVENKVVWITGASRGIGKILADQFAGFGAKLILSARNVGELERVKDEIVSKHTSVLVEILPLDLENGEDLLKQTVQKAESFFSSAGVDYMVHNAAYDRPKSSAIEVPEEVLLRTFKVNVLGTITLTKVLAPFMLKRGRGHFIVMGSAAGKTPSPGQSVYSASKYALNGYFHTLRSDLCKKGIKVTIVCPGPISSTKVSVQSSSTEKRLTSERCSELIIIAATHGLKEAWIANQPVLLVMYLVQYLPTLGYWVMDKVGASRVEAAAEKGNTYSWKLIFGQKKKTHIK
ncbi:Dehydrogenase/reductase SDR family member [Zostera marina]|uniref:Dehydrogenase/reductase SDR family member n=1 Tax=Zostera marina TaxID=29655 RepID=A0A0K9P1Z0_ZOSMR|nr:Dehydrogenase/reductase SDR family member [Zostera marina]